MVIRLHTEGQSFYLNENSVRVDFDLLPRITGGLRRFRLGGRWGLSPIPLCPPAPLCRSVTTHDLMTTDSDSGGQPSESARAARALRPLTKRHANGRLYARRSKTTRQIQDALGLDPLAQIGRAMISDKRDPHYLDDEALVYLTRHHWDRGDQHTGDWLFRWLIERCSGIIAKELTRRLPRQAAIDAGQDLLIKLHDCVCDLGEAGDYLEISFGNWLKCRAIDVRRQWEARLEREAAYRHEPIEHVAGHAPTGTQGGRPTFQPVEPWNELSPSPADLLDQHGAAAMRAEEEKRLRLAVGALPEPKREAVILHFWEGMKIDSTDPDEPTLARHFGKAEKTIRNWLNAAKAELMLHLGNDR